MKKLFVAVLTAGVFASGLAYADEIADRKAIMKQKVGASMGVLVKTAKGEMDYDSAAVVAAFQTMRDGTEGFIELFPAGTESGGETTASAKIWEDMDGFKAAFAKFHTDLDGAIAAAPADKAAFDAQFKQVSANCGTCHETYRIKKQ